MLPDVPTMAEAGIPSYEVYEWNAIFEPLATPEPIIKKLTEAIYTAMQTPEIKERMEIIGGEVYNGNII